MSPRPKKETLDEMARRTIPESLLPPRRRHWPRGHNWRVRDVARYLGVKYKLARYLMVSGKIPAVNVGRGTERPTLRTHRKHIRAYLSERMLRSEAPPKTGKHIDFTQSGRG